MDSIERVLVGGERESTLSHALYNEDGERLDNAYILLSAYSGVVICDKCLQ